MLTFCVDLLVQINIVDEVRRVTSIASLGKSLNGEEPSFNTLWEYDPTSSPEDPCWRQVAETEKSL
jgi:hypothetical protein